MEARGSEVVVALEATLGAGKSTLLRMLVDDARADGLALALGGNVHVEVIQEPLHLVGELLDLFYADKQRWAFTLQMVFFLARNANARERMAAARADPKLAGKRLVFVMERTSYADRECFAAMLHASGMMTDLEYKAYSDRFEHTSLVPIDALVHLRVSPDECFRRMRERGRDAEAPVDVAYLEALSRKHDEWLVGDAYRGIPIERLDGAADAEDVFAALVRMLAARVKNSF